MGRVHSVSLFGVFALLAVLTSGPRVWADVTGTILGTVTDPTGALIVGANVTLRNSNTGLARATTTDTTGSYEFLQVPIGENYVVEVEAIGFQKSV
jgi:hypothetical protein